MNLESKELSALSVAVFRRINDLDELIEKLRSKQLYDDIDIYVKEKNLLISAFSKLF